MKIDAYTHFFPNKYLTYLRKKTTLPNAFGLECAAATDIVQRLRWMDRFSDLMQILSLPTPNIETLVSPTDAVGLAKIANEELAEIVAKYPDKFYAAVGCIPLNDIDAALKEIDHAIKELKMSGIQMFTDINGEGLDLPKFRPIFAKMASYDLPIWIHQVFPKNQPLTQGIGDYETFVAMMQLVASGVFLDYPKIKIITHHCGGIVPIIEGRLRWFDRGIVERNGVPINIIEHLQKFYGDTAVSGSTPALVCGYSFFGVDHMLFATDAPFGPQPNGLMLETIRSVERMAIPDSEKEKIFERNIIELLKIAI